MSNNLQSVRRHNPNAILVTISAGPIFPGGYSINETPDLKRRHAANTKRSSDWLVCSWYRQRRERCSKWWIIEWDTYCTVSIKDYYAPVWRFPFVASNVRLFPRDREWPWFANLGLIPACYQGCAMGATPFLYLLNEDALEAICDTLLSAPFTCGNGELRFATAAAKCGFPPCGFSPPNDQIGWKDENKSYKGKGIFHPVKRLFSGAENLDLGMR